MQLQKCVANRTDAQVERLILREKRLHPTRGPKKLQRILETKHGLVRPPVVSTVGEVLKRHGLVKARRRRGGVFKVDRGELTDGERCNHVYGTRRIKGHTFCAIRKLETLTKAHFIGT